MPSVDELKDFARQAAEQYGIPADLFLRLITQESSWQVGIASPAGAVGLGQFMPDTWTAVINAHPELSHFGVGPNPIFRSNPIASLFASAAHLRDLYDQTSGTQDQRIRDMLIGYNAGPGRMGTPTDQLPAETQA